MTITWRCPLCDGVLRSHKTMVNDYFIECEDCGEGELLDNDEGWLVGVNTLLNYGRADESPAAESGGELESEDKLSHSRQSGAKC